MMWNTVKGSLSSLEKHVSNFLQQIIQEQTTCYFLYESNVKKLEQSVDDLQDRRDRVQRHAEDESPKGKEIAADVLKWLEQVDTIITDKDKFLRNENLPYAVCSKGFLPKPGIKYRLGRIAYRLARKVDYLC